MRVAGRGRRERGAVSGGHGAVTSKSQNGLTDVERREAGWGTADGVREGEGLRLESEGGEVEGGEDDGEADLVGRGELVGVPEEVAHFDFEVHDAVLVGVVGGDFLFLAAAGGCGVVDGAAGGGVGDELRLAEAKAECDVLQRHDGDEREGQAGACEFAKHLVRRVREIGEKSISVGRRPEARPEQGGFDRWWR